MLKAAIKFCGGCNPRYDRGQAYAAIREATKDVAAFSLPAEGARYDVLVILRGCTACPYLYEEIEADCRLVCTDGKEIDCVIRQIRTLHDNKEEEPQT